MLTALLTTNASFAEPITDEEALGFRRPPPITGNPPSTEPSGSAILSAGNLLNPSQATIGDPYQTGTPPALPGGQPASDLRTLMQGGGILGGAGGWDNFPFALSPGTEDPTNRDAKLELRELVSELLDPAHLGDGVIGFSLGGIGDFIVEKSADNTTLHIFETETQLHFTVPTGETAPASEPGAQTGLGQDRRSSLDRLRELAIRLRDFLLSGPRLVLIALLVGTWIAWRTARHLARRNTDHRDTAL